MWYEELGLDPDDLIPLPLEPIRARGVDFDVLDNLQAERGVLETDPVAPVVEDRPVARHEVIVSRIRMALPLGVALLAAAAIWNSVR